MVITYLVSLLIPLAALWFGYPFATVWLLGHWNSEEYSHALLIPFVGAYLTFLNQPARGQSRPEFRYWEIALLSLAVLMLLLAHYGKMISLYGFSLLVMTYGLFLLLAGREATRQNWSALLLLTFMVPLPTALFNGMSNSLQLVSSSLGAWVIELFGITVHLEGNIIDIGSMQMQVVEACSGLRYLFPLMALAYIVAVFHGASLARVALLLLAAIPITILMNSLRIALTAMFAEYININIAEGFLHDFEGWVMFLPALGLLVLFSLAISKIVGTRQGRPDLPFVPQGGFRNQFMAEMRSFANAGQPALAIALTLMIAVAFMPRFLPEKTIAAPNRDEFAVFPMEFNEWKGQHRPMEAIYRNALPWADYLLADYAKPDGTIVNVFIPYFESLYEDSYTHNPAVCLPGNGWTIQEESVKTLSDARLPRTGAIRVNRLIATIGGKQHVVYYWFLHKGTVIANQHMVKPVLLWNSLTEGRTDGALVRLAIGMDTVPNIAAADATLEDIALHVMRVLPSFVPN
ncbi:MAG: VPLPA-CTERM-specific exosortase XrtD [Nitrospirota bacterium]